MANQEDPEYLLGEHGREIERLQKQHAWIQSCLKGQIVFAPVDLGKPGLKVLDVGCADGTLLRDLRKQVSPSAELVGSDIMTSFLPESDGNVRFVKGDVCEPPAEDLTGVFDLTHIRYVLAATGRVGIDKGIANLAATLAPGGWLQSQELDFDPEHLSIGPALKDVATLITSIFEKTGMGARFVLLIEESMKKAGLVNVSVKPISLPMGKAIEDEKERRNSFEPFKITIPALVGAVKGLDIDLPDSVCDHLEDRFEKEALEQGITFKGLIVTGQKPAQ